MVVESARAGRHLFAILSRVVTAQKLKEIRLTSPEAAAAKSSIVLEQLGALGRQHLEASGSLS